MNKSNPEGDRRVRIILLMTWKLRLFRTASANYRAAEAFDRYGRWITCFNMLSAIAVLFFVNNAYFNDANESKIYLSIAGLLTVLSSAFQYIVRFENRSADHKIAAGEFSKIKRKIERYMTIDEIDNDFIHTINRDYNYITQNSPVVPQSIWATARDNLDEIAYWDKKFSEKIGSYCGFSPSDLEQR